MTGDVQGRQERDRLSQAASLDPVSSGPHDEPILDQLVDGDSLYQLRASVGAHALQAGLSGRKAEDLVIAAHELAANVVRHGSGRGRLRIWRRERTLYCELTDEGAEAEPAADSGCVGAHDPSSWRIEPGHGLWLVRELADTLSLHPSQEGSSAVTVSFAFALPDAGCS